MTHYYQNVRGAFTFPKLYYSMVSMFDNAEFAEIGCDCGQSSCFIGVEIINQNKNIKLKNWKNKLMKNKIFKFS